jgi:hypothetical protein
MTRSDYEVFGPVGYRCTARQYAAQHGLPADPKFLNLLGRRGACLARNLDLATIKVTEAERWYPVHSWPPQVWAQAALTCGIFSTAPALAQT